MDRIALAVKAGNEVRKIVSLRYSIHFDMLSSKSCVSPVVLSKSNCSILHGAYSGLVVLSCYITARFCDVEVVQGEGSRQSNY